MNWERWGIFDVAVKYALNTNGLILICGSHKFKNRSKKHHTLRNFVLWTFLHTWPEEIENVSFDTTYQAEQAGFFLHKLWIFVRLCGKKLSSIHPSHSQRMLPISIYTYVEHGCRGGVGGITGGRGWGGKTALVYHKSFFMTERHLTSLKLKQVKLKIKLGDESGFKSKGSWAEWKGSEEAMVGCDVGK